MAVTREQASCVIFGGSQNFPPNVLPTYTDVMKKYFQYRQDMRTPNGKYPSSFDISHELCYEVKQIWKKTSLSIVTLAQAIEKLRSFHSKYKILRAYKERKDRPSHQRRLSNFCYKAYFPFYLIICKCPDMIFNCKSPVENKVLLKEHEFLEDQKGLKKMVIGGNDKKEKSKLKRNAERNESTLQRMKKQKVNKCKS